MSQIVTFDPYAVRGVFLALRRTSNVCNWCQGECKKIDGFSTAFSPKCRALGEF